MGRRVLRADVEPVRARREKPTSSSVVEDRPEDRHVVEVRAGQVRVVHEPDVARLATRRGRTLLGELGADLEVAEEDRQAGRLAEDAVLRVEERDRAVLHS